MPDSQTKNFRAIAACVVLLILLTALKTGAAPVWQPADTDAAAVPDSERWVRPVQSRAFALSPAALRETLERVPAGFIPTAGAGQLWTECPVPMPDGTVARFRVWESPVMAPELAARFPEIKTYAGQGIDDPAATIRFDTTPTGFHAQILSPNGAVYVDPARRGDSQLHLSYYKRDYRRDLPPVACLTTDEGEVLFQPAAEINFGPTLRTYRLAVSATGEYTQFHGGTVAAGLAAIVTVVNRITGIYENDLAVRFMLVANNHLLVFTNAATDPFTNTDPDALLIQNQATTDSVIGPEDYDVGHVLGTAAQGKALGTSVCFDTLKGKGGSGIPSPTGDPFTVDFVAHELGHQFGAFHTFNGISGTCGTTISTNNAHEPGSGSTIMSYAGLCSTDNLQPHSDPYFHINSIRGIGFFLAVILGASDCAVTNATGNTAPFVDAGPDYVIPKGTPFTLIATGSDANGDLLTYCWEEYDTGPAQALTEADNGRSPLFRSFPPTTSPSRTFPQLAALLSNTTSLGEKLPAVSRTNRFFVTARDNRAGGGGVTSDDMFVTNIATAGPFIVTAPNTAVVWSGTRTVTWNVANTTAAPIGTANVKILLSTDGGNTFPIVLAANTANDGSESVVIPDLPTTTARIKVQAVGNIFFDLSDVNFTIDSTPPPALTIADAAVIEGNASRAEATFALQLSAPAAQLVTVNYATADGPALGGLDYIPTNGTAQFPAGQTNQTIVVGVLGDTLFESNETFSITLSSPANATLARSTAIGTIVDDEVRLAALPVSDAHVELRFNSVTGATYRVESSDHLPNTNSWNTLPGAALLPGTGGLVLVLDTNALAQPQRFYRVRQLTP